MYAARRRPRSWWRPAPSHDPQERFIPSPSLDPGSRRRSSPRTDATEQELRRWIAQARYRPGDRLPPDVELAGMLQVARSTVISALDRLVSDGLVTRRQGSGTYVTDAAATGRGERFEVLMPQTEMARLEGIDVELLSVEARTDVEVSDDVADALDILPGTGVTTILQVVGRDGAPAAFFRSFVSPAMHLPPLAELTAMVRAHGSLMQGMLAQGAALATGTTRVSARLVSPESEDGDLLAVRESVPALEVVETLFCVRGMPVCHHRDVVLASGWPLVMHRSLPASRATPPSPLPPRGAEPHLAH